MFAGTTVDFPSKPGLHSFQRPPPFTHHHRLPLTSFSPLSPPLLACTLSFPSGPPHQRRLPSLLFSNTFEPFFMNRPGFAWVICKGRPSLGLSRRGLCVGRQAHCWCNLLHRCSCAKGRLAMESTFRMASHRSHWTAIGYTQKKAMQPAPRNQERKISPKRKFLGRTSRADIRGSFARTFRPKTSVRAVKKSWKKKTSIWARTSMTQRRGLPRP